MSEEVTAKDSIVNRISAQSIVELHFALKLDDGSVVDSTFEKQPAKFTMGDGSLLPGFEQVLIGLPEGVRQAFLIKPEQGFGMPNPNNVQKVKREQFAQDIELTEGFMVSFADANKAELPGIIKSFDEQWVWVDFNHPLAGKTLTFDVQIISVRQPDQMSD
ncbi:FKBP-type peptidyl-prolyl cis-trans isomerase [Zooshikella sp. WH53]|uniref:Peptidyl-prolyl cis-trans isomerase n=1 Tax=Zooshikella harenae TaxID=2827238 RepID=A0ABS5Z811_9GAMM|nr:FKBP-type peptidyl-prolyl cis-trans isomerase [Zooshikella harenae]MBU2710140.1 FKBP-type peptidyl-prolyl cis-trans isomerase [Zooshikella harenae]